MSDFYRKDPGMSVPSDLITDAEVSKAFRNTNFGHDDFRGLLAQGCIKALAGWHQGHTITVILDELGLIEWYREIDRLKVTPKGNHYIWLAFKERAGESGFCFSKWWSDTGVELTKHEIGLKDLMRCAFIAGRSAPYGRQAAGVKVVNIDANYPGAGRNVYVEWLEGVEPQIKDGDKLYLKRGLRS